MDPTWERRQAIGRPAVLTDQERVLRLRRINRIRTIHGSLAIEGNTLSEAQITAIPEGKRVIAPPRDDPGYGDQLDPGSRTGGYPGSPTALSSCRRDDPATAQKGARAERR